jgi:hypothetical protein
MSHVVMPEARVHASDLFISNDMGGSEVSSFALTVFAGIAEFERGLIHQRTRNFLQA